MEISYDITSPRSDAGSCHSSRKVLSNLTLHNGLPVTNIRVPRDLRGFGLADYEAWLDLLPQKYLPVEHRCI